jgi:hypothetical protein
VLAGAELAPTSCAPGANTTGQQGRFSC